MKKLVTAGIIAGSAVALIGAAFTVPAFADAPALQVVQGTGTYGGVTYSTVALEAGGQIVWQTDYNRAAPITNAVNAAQKTANQALTRDMTPGPKGDTGATGATGAQGAAGKDGTDGTNGTNGTDGAQGPAGPQGPSGVVATQTQVGEATIANIGGSWGSRHTTVGTYQVPNGTYLVSINGDFYHTATTTAVPELQVQVNGGSTQLTANAVLPTDNAPVGTTDGAPNGREINVSSTGIVTVTNGSLEVDAFGYNTDQGQEGGGAFGVNTTLTLVQLDTNN